MDSVFVCICYDTEDFIDPSSDDAALWLAETHRRLGVPATFKVVGEKARVLRDRGRTDVIAALAAHEVGYHTNLHSVPPVPTAYCEALDWDNGVDLYRRLETAGCVDVADIFGQAPRTFGQAGSSWAPQSYPTLRELGITVYADATRWIDVDRQPHWFMGLLHPGTDEWASRIYPRDANCPECVGAAVTALRHEVAEAQGRGGGVIAYYYHPNEWSSDVFWDAVNFSHGARRPSYWNTQVSPPRLGWRTQMPPRTTPDIVRQREAATVAWLRGVASCGARAIEARELSTLYPDRAFERTYDAAEIVDATADWTETVDCVAVGGGWLTAGELLTVVAQLVTGTTAAVPQRVDGPKADAPRPTARFTVSSDEVQTVCAELLTRLAAQPERPLLPSCLDLGGHAVGPAELLAAALAVLRGRAAHGPADTVKLAPTALAAERFVDTRPGTFGWVIFPAGFEAPRVLEHARRQAWTIKPAVRGN